MCRFLGVISKIFFNEVFAFLLIRVSHEERINFLENPVMMKLSHDDVIIVLFQIQERELYVNLLISLRIRPWFECKHYNNNLARLAN